MAYKKQKPTIFITAFFVLLVFAPITWFISKNPSTSFATWYDTTWLYRKQLVFNNTGQATNLTNFPVLVSLSNSNFGFSQAQSAGQDIRFTDSDGTTLLPYEIESYDATAKTAKIWVNIPQIDASSSTDFIFIYWGNSGASDAQSADNTWNSNYKGVYHLADNAANTTVTDSSGLANSLTANANTNTQFASSSGKIGKGFITPDGPYIIPNLTAISTEVYPDIVLDSNNFPVIAYYDSTTADLIIVHCNDRNCVGGDESVTAPDTSGTTGQYPSIKLDASGYPVVAYYDATATDLNLLHCNDANCAGGDDTISSVDTVIASVGRFPSLHLDAVGYPVIAYSDATNIDVRLVHCNDANCAGADDSPTTIDGTGGVTVGNTIQSISLDLNSSGYPVVTMYDGTNLDLRLLVCNDANCIGGDDTPVSILTTGSPGSYSSLTLDGSNFPMIAYEEQVGRDTFFLHCNDTLCAGGDDTPVLIDAAQADTPRMILDTSGKPNIAYNPSGINTKIALCSDQTCASVTTAILDLNYSYANTLVSLAVATDNGIALVNAARGRTGTSDLLLYNTSHKLERAYDTDFDFGTASFSVSAWFKANKISDTRQNYLISRYDTDQGFKLYVDNAGHPCFGIDNDSTWGPDDAACAPASDYNTDVDNGLAGAPRQSSVVVDSNNYPVIAYYDNSGADLELIHCNDVNCAGGNESKVSLDSTNATGSNPSLVLDSNGYPVVSYYDSTATDLRLIHCGNANCSASNIINTVDATASVVGSTSSLVLDASGYPVISYYDSTGIDLKVAHCADANCSSVTINTPDSVGNVGAMSSIKLDASGYPIIAYNYATSVDLRVMHCNDANCAGGDDTYQALDTANASGQFPSLQLDTNGYPVIAYYDNTHFQLKLVHCNDANCAGSDDTPNTVLDVESGYYPVEMKLNSSGYPVIFHTAYARYSQMLTICNDANCAGNNESTSIIRIDPTNYVYGSMTLDSNNYPVIATISSLDLTLFRPNSTTYIDRNAADDGSWHHVVGVKNGTSSITLYVDGVAVATDSALAANTTLTSDSASLTLAETLTSNWLSDGNFGGTIDEVQLDTTARSSDWVKAQYLSESNNFINVGITQNGPTSSSLSTFTNNSGALKNNLIAYYKFDEGYGSTTNNSTTSGTVYNGTITGATWTNFGKYNKALIFNGSTNSVSIGTIPNVKSVSFWVNPSTNTQSLLALTAGIYISASSGVISATGFTSPTIYVNGIASTTLTANIWQHITITTSTPISASTITLGRANSSSLTGLLDEMKIYSATLSTAEIMQDYNQKSAISMGSISDTSGLAGGSVASNSASATYCVPGGTGSCSDPVAEWNFEEGSGTTSNDTSGNGNTGTITGATWTSGKIGKGLNFDGASNVVNSGSNASLDNLTNVTIEAWIYPTGWGGGSNGRVIDKGNTDLGSTDAKGMLVNSAGLLGYRHGFSTTAGVWTTPNNSLVLNQWQHVIVVYDNSNTVNNPVIYINGISQTLTETSTPVGTAYSDSAENFLIGNSKATDRGFDGSIDGVRIFNYARTPSQVAWDYNKGKPVGWWKLDECTDTEAHDSSGFGNNGTITIGATGTQTTTGTCSTSGAWFNGASGKFNSSLSFDGTDDEITTADSASLDMGTMSVSAWIKTSNSSDQYIVERNNSTFYLRTQASKLKFWLVGVGATWTTSNKSVDDNIWHHVVATWDGTNKKLYIDGALDITEAGTGGNIASATVGLNIGVRKNSGIPSGYFNGKIDDVRLYNYPLTPTQIKQVYNEGSSIRFGP